MAIPEAVRELVERFDRHGEEYRSSAYNEARLRQEFIGPLFKALGWDVDNEQGRSESYKDVIHEDSIKVGGATKAPDYCFRVGGTRKFFVEAKRPALNLRDHAEAAFRLRRYSWSAKLPLGILTNFAEFAVYDCTVKPGPNDEAGVARILYFTSADLPPRWDEFAGIFARERDRSAGGVRRRV